MGRSVEGFPEGFIDGFGLERAMKKPCPLTPKHKFKAESDRR